MKHNKIIYADGSSLGNPGKAGFGYLIIDLDRKLYFEFGGSVKWATNNQMEILALLEAFKSLKKSSFVGDVEVRLDSQYVMKGITEWCKNWQKNNWKTAAKKDVLNKDLWQEIILAKKELEEMGYKFSFTHVFGHNGEIWNERVDVIARSFADNKKIDLKKGESFK
jgi:ribonuclease HI